MKWDGILFLLLAIFLAACNPNPSASKSGGGQKEIEEDIQEPGKERPILPLLQFTEETEALTAKKQINSKTWTIMFYIGADNDRGGHYLQNLSWLSAGYQGGCNAVVFLDKSLPSTFTTKNILKEEFSGQRIYQIQRRSGGTGPEDNSFQLLHKEEGPGKSANILVLKQFIEYCKENFPADHYALFLHSHGSYSSCIPSGHLGRSIPISDFSEKLEEKDSIDVLAMDVCNTCNLDFMKRVSNRNKFHIDYVIGTPETAHGWDLEYVFERINPDSTKEIESKQHELTGEARVSYRGEELTPLQFGRILMEEYYSNPTGNDYWPRRLGGERLKNFRPMVLCDIQQVRGVTAALETLLKSCSASELRKLGGVGGYTDVYKAASMVNGSAKFSQEVREQAARVQESVDRLILYSCAGENYANFQNGTYGLSYSF